MISDFRLNVFVTVAQNLSFTKAAEILKVSQPAITKQIKELERLCGQALFFRQGHRIELTLAGQQLVPHAQAILHAYGIMNRATRPIETTFSGNLRVGASTTIAQYVLPKILAAFQRQYPNISVTLQSGNSSDISQAVIDQSIDMGIVEGQDTRSELHYEELCKDQIVLLNAHLRKRRLNINDLHQLPLVVREKGSGTLDVILKALSKHRVKAKDLNIRLTLDSTEAILRYLCHSEAYAFVSVAALEPYINAQQLHIIPIENLKIERWFRFVTLHGSSHRQVELFKSFCTKTLHT